MTTPTPSDSMATAMSVVAARATGDRAAELAILTAMDDDELRGALLMASAVVVQVASRLPGGVPFLLDTWQRFDLEHGDTPRAP